MLVGQSCGWERRSQFRTRAHPVPSRIQKHAVEVASAVRIDDEKASVTQLMPAATSSPPLFNRFPSPSPDPSCCLVSSKHLSIITTATSNPLIAHHINQPLKPQVWSSSNHRRWSSREYLLFWFSEFVAVNVPIYALRPAMPGLACSIC
jgi:hypothetical protein